MSKCSVCGHDLSVPAVYFLCKHSYHFHCYEEYDAEQSDQCPKCVLNNTRFFIKICLKKLFSEFENKIQQNPTHTQFINEVILKKNCNVYSNF